VFVSMTRVRTSSDEPPENATIVAEEMVRWLKDIEGFEGMIMLAGEGSAVGLTFWQSREVAERHRVARMEFIERMLSVAEVEIQEIVGYDLRFSQLAPTLSAFEP
jgi:hypothetical protein